MSRGRSRTRGRGGLCRLCKKRKPLVRLHTQEMRRMGYRPKYVKLKHHDLCQKCQRAEADRHRGKD